ncbi:hypothetical protein E2C01_023223 [Portunus trituberculatus]|uniref:Uncharacterized protein n=1 Tax=Portunus trituberculatus TaxID=210409 RepID=A0A5B7E965_PORTR|nr:hypothetical protein [Portunus trituberculatus]
MHVSEIPLTIKGRVREGEGKGKEGKGSEETGRGKDRRAGDEAQRRDGVRKETITLQRCSGSMEVR